MMTRKKERLNSSFVFGQFKRAKREGLLYTLLLILNLLIMNKKFSTLMMAGMLGAGSSFVSAQDAVMLNGKPLKLVEIKADDSRQMDNVILLRDGGTIGEIDEQDLVILATKDQNGTLTYTVKKLSELKDAGNDDAEDAAVWNIKEHIMGTPDAPKYYYSLQSANTGDFVTISTKGGQYSVVTEAGKMIKVLTLQLMIIFVRVLIKKIPFIINRLVVEQIISWWKKVILLM